MIEKILKNISLNSPPCAIVLTALPVEFNAVKTHLRDIVVKIHKGTVYESGLFDSEKQTWQVVVVEIGAGNDRAAFETERAVNYFDPSIAIFVGVAGGIKDVRFGDVVVASKAHSYESGKAEKVFKPRPEAGKSSYNLVQCAKAVARNQDWTNRIKNLASENLPKAFVGAIAAGEKVIASKKSDVYEFLRANYSDALAVEMEGRGFLEAAYANPQISSLIVRGISDSLDDKSNAVDDLRQEIASRNASAFAFEVLSRLESAPRNETSNQDFF